MKLWHVTRTDEGANNYEYTGVVVRAETADRVREIVVPGVFDYSGKNRGFPGFTDTNIKIVELTAAGDEEIILSDFHVG